MPERFTPRRRQVGDFDGVRPAAKRGQAAQPFGEARIVRRLAGVAREKAVHPQVGEPGYARRHPVADTGLGHGCVDAAEHLVTDRVEIGGRRLGRRGGAAR